VDQIVDEIVDTNDLSTQIEFKGIFHSVRHRVGNRMSGKPDDARVPGMS
jgi:hypothetical protein